MHATTLKFSGSLFVNDVCAAVVSRAVGKCGLVIGMAALDRM